LLPSDATELAAEEDNSPSEIIIMIVIRRHTPWVLPPARNNWGAVGRLFQGAAERPERSWNSQRIQRRTQAPACSFMRAARPGVDVMSMARSCDLWVVCTARLESRGNELRAVDERWAAEARASPAAVRSSTTTDTAPTLLLGTYGALMPRRRTGSLAPSPCGAACG
jgi:hypothetical protein